MGKDIYEIRWHGRGGQGAKTAATLVAEVAIHEGKYSQGFPEYGPERMGAPIRGFTRISERPITIHAAIYSPDCVVVLDDTLLGAVDVAENLAPDGVMLVNTVLKAAEVRKRVALSGAQRLYLIDATGISIAEIGRPIPNTPMIGAFIKTTGTIKVESLIDDMKHKFGAKFSQKIIDGNVNAVKRAYNEVEAG